MEPMSVVLGQPLPCQGWGTPAVLRDALSDWRSSSTSCQCPQGACCSSTVCTAAPSDLPQAIERLKLWFQLRFCFSPPFGPRVGSGTSFKQAAGPGGQLHCLSCRITSNTFPYRAIG